MLLVTILHYEEIYLQELQYVADPVGLGVTGQPTGMRELAKFYWFMWFFGASNPFKNQ